MMNRSTGRPFTILALLAVVGCGANTGAWKVANSAYLDCVGSWSGGGLFNCDEGGEGKPHHCAHTVLGHEVVVKCDGKQCVCSVDGVGGAPFPTTGPPYPSCTVLK